MKWVPSSGACWLLSIAMMGGILLGLPGHARAGETIRVNQRDAGELGVIQTDDRSFQTTISGDGRFVAYTTFDNNLFPDPTRRFSIHLWDRSDSSLKLVDVNSSGQRGTNERYGVSQSQQPWVTDVGHVVFTSDANNFETPSPIIGIYLRDPFGNTTSLVSKTTAGDPMFEAEAPYITGNGRYVVFDGCESFCVNGVLLVWLRDLSTGTTQMVSINNNGDPQNDDPYLGGPAWSSASEDGKKVAWVSMATNLAVLTTTGVNNIYVRDLSPPGQTVIASIANDGSTGNNHSNYPRISRDGRYVAFLSDATNLVFNFGPSQAYVRDLINNQTILVSVDNNGTPIGASTFVSISGDGRFVNFSNGNVYLHDRDPDENGIFDEPGKILTSRVDVDSSGVPADSGSSYSEVSSNGSFVAFSSFATNLVPGDTNGHWDIFLHNNTDTSQDTDGDGIPDSLDNCPTVYNPNQADGDVNSDGTLTPDGVGDLCDNCPTISNPPDIEFGQPDVCSENYSGDTGTLSPVLVQGCFQFTDPTKDYVVRPTCANTVWELTDPEGNVLPVTGCVNGPAVGIPDDLVPILDGSGNPITYCTEPCKLLDRFLPDALTAPALPGETITYDAKGIFTTLVQCPPGDQNIPLSETDPTNVCPKILMVSVESDPVPVTIGSSIIDIYPGTFPNLINLGASGTTPVGIFGSPTFDITKCMDDGDLGTIRLAGFPVAMNPAKKSQPKTYMASTKDLDGDGYLDLVVHFVTKSLKYSSTNLSGIKPNDPTVTLIGSCDGTAFTGQDSIRVVK